MVNLNDDLVDEIVGTFSEFGEIILVRFVDEDMWLIFKNGQMALEAVHQDKLEIAGKKISVRLKTANWKEINLLELRASSLQTEPLFNTTTNSLLGEDFEIADIDCYDSEGDDDDDDGVEEQEPLPEPIHPSRSASSSPHSGTQSPAEAMMLSGSNTSLEKAGVPPPRPQPASQSRPPPPAARPRETTPPQQQNIADTLIVPEQVSKVRGAAPEQSVNKPGPPQRPGPPAKPPPPQRPPGGPPRPSAGAPGAQSKPPSSPQRPRKPMSGPPIKQPLGPQAIGKIKSKQQNKITRIGLPTNVTHMGHAKSPEEAAALIEKLLQSGGPDMKGTLPAPLKPGLKPNQSNIPKSKTSDNIPLSADTVLQPPQGMQRVQSAENITTASSQPVPALRKDSLEGKEADEESKPRPAPRRNIQSCYIESNSGLSSAGPTTAPPPVVPRPQSMIDRGTLPAVPKALPETSQNYYSSVVDHSKIDAEKGQILLNGSNKSETVYEPTEYETIWGAKTTNVGVVAPALPAVPKRRDLAPEGESLLDKPMSPNAKKPSRDPFDTSAISQMLPT
ncbi:synaptojanin-1-like, partial [Ruditapes philippinarum]|uniref:synaptojanin-1-like n=1 Tax=Ruditapes philippinarum TaxID=129788 RepID=UPI00295B7F2E